MKKGHIDHLYLLRLLSLWLPLTLGFTAPPVLALMRQALVTIPSELGVISPVSVFRLALSVLRRLTWFRLILREHSNWGSLLESLVSLLWQFIMATTEPFRNHLSQSNQTRGMNLILAAFAMTYFGKRELCCSSFEFKYLSRTYLLKQNNEIQLFPFNSLKSHSNENCGFVCFFFFLLILLAFFWW